MNLAFSSWETGFREIMPPASLLVLNFYKRSFLSYSKTVIFQWKQYRRTQIARKINSSVSSIIIFPKKCFFLSAVKKRTSTFSWFEQREMRKTNTWHNYYCGIKLDLIFEFISEVRWTEKEENLATPNLKGGSQSDRFQERFRTPHSKRWKRSPHCTVCW